MKQRDFGKNKQGKSSTIYTFTNMNGMTIEVTDFGASLVSVLVPNKYNEVLDVVLGYEDVKGYEAASGTYFGATVGRNSNRIGNATFSLNGVQYQLDKNNNKNNLHGGYDAYSYRVWDVKECTENSITFMLHSPDGDQGFPGALYVEVTYTLTDDNSIKIDYFAVPTEDTIINMTNHSYFNLNGHNSGNILNHKLWMDSDVFTPTDSELIPTGEIVSVEATPMDFRIEKTVGKDIDEAFEPLVLAGGYDHNWGLNNNGKFAKVAEFSSDASGIKMEVYTDLPGVQIYSGNFLVNESGKQGAVYTKNQGICFETQYFPDAINHEEFISPICKKGEEYRTTTVYKFVAEKE